VDTNGVVSFVDPGVSSDHIGPIPSEADSQHAPNLAVYPFWDDWVVDMQASIRTATTGTAPNRQFTVEWRNVTNWRDPTARVSFEVTFSENGLIAFAWTDLDDSNAVERGATGVVGVEDADGTVAFMQSAFAPVLGNGRGLLIDTGKGATGAITGIVTCGGTAVSGASVTVGDVSTSTAADGRYTLSAVPVGSYVVVVTPASGTCRGSTPIATTVTKNVVTTVNAPLTTAAAYRATPGPRTFVPANQSVLDLTGDDAYAPLTLPFPVTLYGQSYQAAWVDTNGVVSFTEPNGAAWEFSAIPSEPARNRPDAAVYAFWDDWMVDGEASVRTATIGTAPNRQFVVEWRNVINYRDTSSRVTFEVIFGENGQIIVAWDDIGPRSIERGAGATVGLENSDGTAAIQYLYRHLAIRDDYGVVFQAVA
jgi:hypothetical protein